MTEILNELNPLYIDKNIRCISIGTLYEGQVIYYLVNISEEERLRAIERANKQVPKIVANVYPEYDDDKYWINERFLLRSNDITYCEVWKENPNMVLISETPEEFELQCVDVIRSIVRRVKKEGSHKREILKYKQSIRNNCSKYKCDMSEEEKDLAYPEKKLIECQLESWRRTRYATIHIPCVGGSYC